MSYTAAALLGVAGALLVDLFVLRTRLVLRPVFWATYPIIVFFQLISNGILTGRDIVRYDPAAILGPRLVHAPVEDLLFGFALVLLTLAVWVRLGRAGVQRTPAAGDGPGRPRLLNRNRRVDPDGRLGRNGRVDDPDGHATDRS
ncbi:lycopene cyclase domain-containing protein [Plantactinospora sp. S1510]|uniref:Lycopene cyclase domain-containing protein n=1 Tax=Plantactinospora alkalitolerans TaxID=2789879 RepID=A0ABS0H7U1_9ACTN|nr:lycopene cyclase domain-containing protein [Plantactinospora alkalitolerans]MBF9134552.1 lycopene cyclase domain-containing protein [Plantactinospora alkalitolerans]